MSSPHGSIRTPPGRARKPSWFKKLLVALGVLVGLCLGLEGAYRGWCRLGGRSYSSDGVRRELLHIVNTMNQPVPTTPEDAAEIADTAGTITHIVHPYYGFDVPEMHRRIGQQLQSFRRERAGPAPFRVLIVGGSVSGMLAVHGGERLVELLREDARLAGREVELLNHGRGSFKQPQQVMLVEYLLALGFEPDVVVNVDGFNEVALGSHNADIGIHPTYPHWPRWAHLAGLGTSDADTIDLSMAVWSRQREARSLSTFVLDAGLHRSAILGRLTAARLYTLRSDWGRLLDRYTERLAQHAEDSPVRGPTLPTGEVGDPLDWIVRAWVEGSSSIQAICAERSIAYLHVLQPTLHDGGSKPLTAEERRTGEAPAVWVEGVAAGYPLMRTASTELVERGVHFLDCSQVFAGVDETLYFDACHFNDRGNELLAESVAAGILDLLPLEPAPLRTPRRSGSR